MVAERILLFGAGGQLGKAFVEAWNRPEALIALTRDEANLAEPGKVAAAIARQRPDAVINAAAYTAVDKAESEPERVHRINADAVREMAEACAALDIPLLHYSTDYVFDGAKSGSYTETDAPVPLSVYGRSKQAGEHAAAFSPKHLVLRTSWVFGPHGGNFLRTILRLAAERESLRVVDDQIGAPTATALIVSASLAAWDRMRDAPAGDPRWGVYHLAAAGETSWCGYARWIVQQASYLGKPLRLQATAIHAVPSVEYPTAARRPLNSRLDCGKFHRTFAVDLPDWRDGALPTLIRMLQPLS
jgi:dTDP-4-dehydrorhamnose reductase